MHIPERVIRLAKQRALAGFASLAEKTVLEADVLMSKSMQSSANEQRGIGGARALLRGEGGKLRIRMDEHYATYLERAMQTMHTDLRTGLHNINADLLTLIDDDVVTRQIEVDRMVIRLRDADSLSLGRLNLTIAQLHGESDVKERENPFRPYLLARALHEALREVARDEGTQKLLFETMAHAMASQLPGFYGAILEVFEAGGLSSRLTARPGTMSRAQRDRLAWQKAADQLLDKVDSATASIDNPQHEAQARMLPRLKRLMEAQQGDGVNAPQPSPRLQAQHLQDLVWEVFRQPKLEKLAHAGAAEEAPGRSLLEMQLMQLQRAAMRDLSLAEGAVPAPQPLGLREQISDTAASAEQRVTVDLVSLLFESIVHDDQVPASVRKQLGLLHLPFLRAAVIDPAMLHEPGHPARRLLDRIGTATAGIGQDNPAFPQLEAHIGKVLAGVLERFDGDPAVFAEAEHDLDRFIAALLPANDASLARYAEAMEEAETATTAQEDMVFALGELLRSLQADPRVSNFVTGIWSKVLAHPGPEAAAYKAILPELLWSAQEKTLPEERTALMRLLPDLVRRVRAGLEMIGLPDQQSKAALDQLVHVHMDVLGNKQAPPLRRMSLDQLRHHFEAFQAGAAGPAQSGAAPMVSRAALDASLARRGLRATLHTESNKTAPSASDLEKLSCARPGAPYEFMVDGKFTHARLDAVSPRKGVYLMRVEGSELPDILVRSALADAISSGILQALEQAPVFDRAVDSLLAGADSLTPAGA